MSGEYQNVNLELSSDNPSHPTREIQIPFPQILRNQMALWKSSAKEVLVPRYYYRISSTDLKVGATGNLEWKGLYWF